MREWLRASLAWLLGWLLVLVGCGALAVIWFSADPVDSAQVIGTVVALVALVSGGCAVLWKWSRAGVVERRSVVARLAPELRRPGRLRRLGEVELTYLGVRVPRHSQSDSIAQLSYASRWVLDPQLRAALSECRFVLVHGPSAAGKSRSTAETARALYRDRPVLVPPVRKDSLTELLTAKVVTAGTVVWLDDMDRHIGVGVDAGVVRSLLTVDRVIVVATIRAAAYEALKPKDELKPPGSDVIELAKEDHCALVAFTTWDEADREQAAQQYIGHPDVVDALSNGMGLGEYLVAGPELVERVETGDPPASGIAVVAAATDWYRAGMTRPAPVDLVRKLYPLYLPPDDASLLERFQEALRWACTPVSGARLLTNLTDGSGLAVHDYYLDHVWKHSMKAVPSRAWDVIADELADAPIDLTGLAVMLHESGDPLKAERLFRVAADAGISGAMYNLGIGLVERGELVEAERWFRVAADAGFPAAMYNLGILLAGRGELVETERWFRAAASAGFPDAMYSLGFVLDGRGESVEAERWFRAAADAGFTGAMFSVGLMLDGRGELDEAERWYRAAADAGSPAAMNNLGILLVGRGELVEAERWYRVAADAGSPAAMYSLGVLLAEQGDLAEAERWYREPADAGDPDAMSNLGLLLEQRGELVEAERWFRSASAAGSPSAMYSLGLLLEQRGELVEAERWFRSASAAGFPDAMNSLGVMLAKRGELVEAERWSRAAADAGFPDAMYSLGILLTERGDLVEAERWYRAAADAGSLAAMNNLGLLLEHRGELVEAERWLREAADAGLLAAMNNLEGLLHRPGSSSDA
ncbi:sel1 repeat family protein [Kribbella sp. NBC_01505]|uniref:tetratricopeptide repeat protein n=1 Tax=Kribbella sp. NBC_01505 TaxID=2903580 RepID=UPI0038670860